MNKNFLFRELKGWRNVLEKFYSTHFKKKNNKH